MTQEERAVPKLTIFDKILEKSVLLLIPRSITPNMISWARFVSVPFVGYFLWTGQYGIGILFFAISAFSDAVDGSLARTRDMVTDFGKMFDPLADKLLIAVVALILIPHYLSLGIVVAMVFIDLMLITSAWVHKRYYGVVIQAENAGKLKMIAQSVGLFVLLLYVLTGIALFLVTAQYLFYAAILFGLMSLVVYKAV